MRTNSSYLVTLLAFVMLACGDGSVEGPIGPEGIGPEGTIGPESLGAGVLIEHSISDSSYDAEGRITIRDERITPTTFEGLYLKVTSSIVEYLPIKTEFEVSERAGEVRAGEVLFIDDLSIGEGFLSISDPDRFILDLMMEIVERIPVRVTVKLAVLVSVVPQ